MHRSGRSLKDPGGEQDAPLGRPKAPLKQTVLTVLSVLSVYPELTPGKQYVTFKVVMVPRIFWTPDSGPEQAHPWEHEPCSLATCVLPMKLSMVDQHLNMQRCP